MSTFDNPFQSPVAEPEPPPEKPLPYATEPESFMTVALSLVAVYCFLTAGIGLVGGIFVTPAILIVAVPHFLVGLSCVSRRRKLMRLRDDQQR